MSFPENVKRYEDSVSDSEIIQSIIDTCDDQEPFYILNVADVARKHSEWIARMPRIVPHYAIKCNSDPTVIRILADMNAKFDCASRKEIELTMAHGVSGDRIIFAHPTKLPSHIRYAKSVNVRTLVADNEYELVKISEQFPEANVLIRIRCDGRAVGLSLGSKFGCDPKVEAISLIHRAKSLGLTLYGFSFHVGSPCEEPDAYVRGIATCERLIRAARAIGGCETARLIDIGGGFPGDIGCKFDEYVRVINEAIRNVDPTIRFISEPGQYYVVSAFTLASSVNGKKLIELRERTVRMYYMTCGVYNSFIDELLGLKARSPIALRATSSSLDEKETATVTGYDAGERFLSCFWGPTLDSTDCLLRNVLAPEFEIGDWLLWRNMGAYSVTFAFPYNGYGAPSVYPFARPSEWCASARPKASEGQ